jgi:hypothetical protein
MSKDLSNAERMGTVGLNGQSMEVFQVEPEFPCNPKRRAACEEHFREDRPDEMYRDFWMMGCDFPVAVEEGRVFIGFACKGQGRFSRRCGLTLTQYSEDGRVLNQGTYE